MEREPYYDSEGGFHDICFYCGHESCQNDHIYHMFDYRKLKRNILAKSLMMFGFIEPDRKIVNNSSIPKVIRYCSCGSRINWRYKNTNRCSRCTHRLGRSDVFIKVEVGSSERLTLEILLAMRPEQLGWYERVAKAYYLAHKSELGEQKAFKDGLKEAEKADDKRKRESRHSWIRQGTTKEYT